MFSTEVILSLVLALVLVVPIALFFFKRPPRRRARILNPVPESPSQDDSEVESFPVSDLALSSLESLEFLEEISSETPACESAEAEDGSNEFLPVETPEAHTWVFQLVESAQTKTESETEVGTPDETELTIPEAIETTIEEEMEIESFEVLEEAIEPPMEAAQATPEVAVMAKEEVPAPEAEPILDAETPTITEPILEETEAETDVDAVAEIAAEAKEIHAEVEALTANDEDIRRATLRRAPRRQRKPRTVDESLDSQISDLDHRLDALEALVTSIEQGLAEFEPLLEDVDAAAELTTAAANLAESNENGGQARAA